MISTQQIHDTIIDDANDLGVSDQQSITVLAVGRIAQATLANEVERMTASGASADDIAMYREARGAQLDRWMALETERARTQTIVREEVKRCLG